MAVDHGPEEPPHPRTRTVLFGHAEATSALAEAERAGRLHHAWLIGGPEGVGKATLAYRFARHLLAGPTERLAGGDGLGIDASSRTSRQIAAGSHPNLMVMERERAEGDKGPRKTIPVDAVRKALGFFNTTAVDSGYRVCVVDAVEDLTLAGANALLKTVEEPPVRGLILLISHTPQRVLPTIRSRCRKLSLTGLPASVVGQAIAALGPDFSRLDPADVARAALAGDGSVGRALAVLAPKTMALLDEVQALLEALPEAPPRGVLALAERLGNRQVAAEFGLAIDYVQAWVAALVRARAELGPARLAPLAEVCENLAESARAVETYNLDRRPLIVSIFGDLAEAVRRAA